MQDTDISRDRKEMDKKYPFGFLEFINLAILPVCFVLDVLFVDLNDHVILVPIFLQLVQVWMMIQSYDYIDSNYPAREDPVVPGYVVLPWHLFESGI